MAKSSDVKKTFIKAGLAGADCKFSNLGRALSESPRILPATTALCPDCGGSGRRTHPGDGGGFGGNRCSRCEGRGMVALKQEPQFVGIRRAVMLEGDCVAVAKSKTFAKRIANALNKHVPNREGV